jgi:hypothetical protein
VGHRRTIPSVGNKSPYTVSALTGSKKHYKSYYSSSSSEEVVQNYAPKIDRVIFTPSLDNDKV